MARTLNCTIMAGPANRRIQVATETRHIMSTGERIGRAIMWVVITIIALAILGWAMGVSQSHPPVVTPAPSATHTPTSTPAAGREELSPDQKEDRQRADDFWEAHKKQVAP